MIEIVCLLTKHGYWLLFLCVLGRQACLPIPANLVVLAAGALAGVNKLSIGFIISFTVTAFVLADLAWYEVGRRYGSKTLHFIRKVTRSQSFGENKLAGVFARCGVKALLFSKFMVGLDALAAPACGFYRIDLSLFLLFDALGATLWAVVYVGLGYVFRAQLNTIAAYSAQIGTAIVWACVATLGFFVIRRVLRHYRLLRACQLPQISPDQLACRLIAGEKILIVDVRGSAKGVKWPIAIPGAIRCDPRQLSRAGKKYGMWSSVTTHEVVLYCSDPDDAASVRVALSLGRSGCSHIRILAGGLQAWRGRGYPVTRDVQILQSTEYEVYVLREVLQYSREQSAAFLKTSTTKVDEVMKQTNEHLGKRPIVWPTLLEHCGAAKLLLANP